MEAILSICEQCVAAINEAAWKSYRDGENADSYDGCSAEVSLSPDTLICVIHDPKAGFTVQSSHESNQETPLFDKAVTDYLEDNANPEAEWQETYDNNDHDRQAVLDSGFGSWQDYYDYMYN